MAIFEGRAHDVGQNLHGQLDRDVLDKIEFAERHRLDQDLADQGADAILVDLDGLGREAAVDERAQARVARRIHVEQRHARLDLLGR